MLSEGFYSYRTLVDSYIVPVTEMQTQWLSCMSVYVSVSIVSSLDQGIKCNLCPLIQLMS